MIASFGVLVGMWLERFLIVVPSLGHKYLPYSWGTYRPRPVEILITDLDVRRDGAALRAVLEVRADHLDLGAEGRASRSRTRPRRSGCEHALGEAHP